MTYRVYFDGVVSGQTVTGHLSGYVSPEDARQTVDTLRRASKPGSGIRWTVLTVEKMPTRFDRVRAGVARMARGHLAYGLRIIRNALTR